MKEGRETGNRKVGRGDIRKKSQLLLDTDRSTIRDQLPNQLAAESF